MSLRKPRMVATLFVGVVGLVTAIIFACGGTVRPNCFQTAWLAKFVPTTIVLPTSPAAITVPVGLLPFALWNTNPACAQPTGASIDLTFTCTPVGGGAPIVVGPMTFPAGIPTTPGPQPVAGGAVSFVIPAGTLTPGIPYACAITGMYTVSFGGGLGAPSVIGMGDTEVCIVPPTPVDETLPRLNMELLVAEGEEAFQSCRRGDQTINHYLIENNDPTESVSLTFTSSTNQVAGMPGGDDPDSTFFAISNPTPGSDAFPQEIDVSVADFIELPDPNEVSDREVSTTITLAPNALAVVSVAIRSFGMCADGSCSEVLTRVTGEFSDGQPALGCAGTALLVDDVPAKSPLCEETDELNVSPIVDAQWSLAIFDGDEKSSTHFAGNLPDDQGGPGTQTTGAELRQQFNIEFFEESASDYIRVEMPPSNVQYSVDAFPQVSNFQQQTNNVTIMGLPESGPVRAPLIFRDQQQSQLDLTFDFGSDMLTIADADLQTEQQVSISGLPGSLPPEYMLDEDTFREFECSGIPDTPLMEATPGSIAQLFAGETPESDLRMEIEITDPRSGNPIAWMAESDSDAVMLSSESGTAGQNVVVTIDPDQVAESPDTTIGTITVTSAALNSPLRVPVALRKTSSFSIIPGTGGGNGNNNGSGGGGMETPNLCGNCGDTGVAGFVTLLGGLGLMQRRNRSRRLPKRKA